MSPAWIEVKNDRAFTITGTERHFGGCTLVARRKGHARKGYGLRGGDRTERSYESCLGACKWLWAGVLGFRRWQGFDDRQPDSGVTGVHTIASAARTVGLSCGSRLWDLRMIE